MNFNVGFEASEISVVTANWHEHKPDGPIFEINRTEGEGSIWKEGHSRKMFAAMVAEKFGLDLLWESQEDDEGGVDEGGGVVLGRRDLLLKLWEDTYMYCDAVGFDALVDAREIRKILTGLVEPVKSKGTVHMMVQGAQGPEFISMPRKVESPLERGNYSDSALAGYERVTKDLEGSNPAGRIAIFDGPPGTGKTHLLKSLLTECGKTAFVLVSPDLLTSMTGPGVLPALLDFSRSQARNRSITFLVEDADECIAKRGGDNMSAVSAVLNLGDGILGQLLDIRLVLTTNAKRKEMDEAVTRPGRLSALVKVDVLPIWQCETIYKRLTNKDPYGIFERESCLAEVYSKAFDSGWTPPSTTKSLGFQIEEE
jgi:hypothetical protein